MSVAELHVVHGSQEDWPYSFELLPTQSLFIDEGYQRPLSRFVKDIINGFDPSLVGTLSVSKRRTRYAVIDGQTRLVAAKQIGHLKVPCVVYHGLSREQEAYLFSKFQTERRAMSAFHRFRAAVVARDETAVAIEKMVKAAGFELSDSAGVDTIAAVSACEAAYKRGPEILERTLKVIYEAWTRRKHAATGEVIRGLAFYFQHNDNVDDAKLARHLSVVEPATLSRRAAAIREGRGSSGNYGGNTPRYMAEAIAAAYRSRPKVEA